MAASYDLVTTQSSIQVISPTVVLDVVVATIKTKPHGVFLDYWIAKDAWDAGVAPTLLTAVADGVEHIMDTLPVSAAYGSTVLDPSGLLAELVTFTVAYQTPGSTFPPATVDVEVPVSDFGQDTLGGVNAGLDDVTAKIKDAYAKLQAAAGVTVTAKATAASTSAA